MLSGECLCDLLARCETRAVNQQFSNSKWLCAWVWHHHPYEGKYKLASHDVWVVGCKQRRNLTDLHCTQLNCPSIFIRSALFIYLWLHWIFAAFVRSFSQVGELFFVVHRLPPYGWLLVFWSMGCRCVGFSSGGTGPQQLVDQWALGQTGSVALV